MRGRNMSRSRGFSLIELVIVVVIIGIIGAIAIPRMSRGASGAADGALKANLAVLRNALDLYAAEHGNEYPTLAKIEAQLTQKSDADGKVQGDAGVGDLIYGPYLRSVPPLPVGDHKGQTAFTDTPGTASKGWVYDEDEGTVKANTVLEEDEAGTLYSTY